MNVTSSGLDFAVTATDKQVLVDDYVLLTKCYTKRDPSYATMSEDKKKQMLDFIEHIGAIVAEQLKDRKYFNSFMDIINDVTDE